MIRTYNRDGTTTGDFCIDLYEDMLPRIGQSVRWTDLRGDTYFGKVVKRDDRRITVAVNNGDTAIINLTVHRIPKK